MKVIFLDIDGVLNHQAFYHKVSKSKRIQTRFDLNDEWGEMFCPKSTELLNELISKTDAKIVISSSKRFTSFITESYDANLNCIKHMWKNRGFVGEVIGTTPHLWIDGRKTYHIGYNSTIPRGCEIEAFLEKHLHFHHINWSKEEQLKYMEKSNIENYIIIDDDSDMLYTQRNHFVHVLPSPRNVSGFNKKYQKIALNKLSKTIIDLNYDY
jgi:hypothetical protein